MDILLPADRQHILYGDGPGSGGHLWPGQPGKTPFPQGWSADKVIDVVGDIATSPNTQWYIQSGGEDGRTASGSAGRWVAYETRDGVRVKVVVEPITGRVVTSHPDDRPVPQYKPIRRGK